MMQRRTRFAAAVSLLLGIMACGPDPRSIEGRQQFYGAIIRGEELTVAAFLKRGAEPNASPSDALRCSTPLALARSAAQITRLLLDAGAQPNAPAGKDGETALMCAQTVDVARLLLDRGAAINATDRLGNTALLAAAGRAFEAYSNDYRDVAIVKLLIDRGADVNAGNARGETALMLAAQAGRQKATEVLIARGAQLNVRSKEGHSAAQLAAQLGHEEVVNILRTAGARVSASLRVVQPPRADGLTSLFTSEGTIYLNETWDEALPKLGRRLELRREGPDRFVDVRFLNEHTILFTFERPTAPSLGPYRIVKIDID